MLRQATNTHYFKDKMMLYAQFVKHNKNYHNLLNIDILDIMCENNDRLVRHVDLVQRDNEQFYDGILGIDRTLGLDAI